MGNDTRQKQVAQYEIVFSIFMAAVAYLWKDNPDLILPEALYLFVTLMAVNLAAGVALRLAPEREEISTAFVLANCGVVTAILAFSGGASSNLWVLYLLPIYTACLLLSAHSLVLVTGGAIVFNAAYVIFWCDGGQAQPQYFELFVKGGVLCFAAVVTGRLVQRDRSLSLTLEGKRAQLVKLEQNLGKSEKLAEVGLLSSGAAHDVSNAFAAILGFSELLLEEDLSPSGRREVETIRRSAGLGQGVVRSLLGAIRGQKAALERCALAEVSDSVLGIMRSAVDAAGITVERAYADEGVVLGNRVQLERVFLNLVSNAVRAMPRGGVLRVAIVPDPPGSAGRRHLRVIVQDSGAGIPAEMLPKLFKAFSTSRPEAGGTGLGLFICREIAAQHGGMLSADNAPEGGARFTLLLPEAVAAGEFAPAAR